MVAFILTTASGERFLPVMATDCLRRCSSETSRFLKGSIYVCDLALNVAVQNKGICPDSASRLADARTSKLIGISRRRPDSKISLIVTMLMMS